MLRRQSCALRAHPSTHCIAAKALAGSSEHVTCEAIPTLTQVRAAEKRGNERGERYLIGNQRLRTADYYALIAELSGQPPPRYEVPAWLAIGAAHLASAYASYVSGSAPTAPADLVRTATRGTLLFDASKSERELGMVYTAIRSAFAEAVDLVTSPASSGVHVPDDHADAAAGLLADAD